MNFYNIDLFILGTMLCAAMIMLSLAVWIGYLMGTSVADKRKHDFFLRELDKLDMHVNFPHKHIWYTYFPAGKYGVRKLKCQCGAVRELTLSEIQKIGDNPIQPDSLKVPFE